MKTRGVWAIAVVLALSIVGILLAQASGPGSAAGQGTNGRWTIMRVSVPKPEPEVQKLSTKSKQETSRNAPGDAMLLDTATGRTWLLRHDETRHVAGDVVETWAWFPVGEVDPEKK